MFLGQIKPLHKGHCGNDGGYLPPNTNQESAYDCRDECLSRTKYPGYFAYKAATSVTDTVCACYTRAGGCYSDGKHLDHLAYEILDSGQQFLHISIIYPILVIKKKK